MSDILFYECGHAIAQRDISEDDTISVPLMSNSDQVAGECPNCQSGKSKPHDTHAFTKDDLLLRGLIRGKYGQ